MTKSLVAAAVLTIAAWPGPVSPQEPSARRAIDRSDDLPRHTYAVTTTAMLMEDEASFAALAHKLEGDLRADLAAYEIRDRATLKSYYETLGKLALRRDDDAAALAWFDSLRATEDKPALRLTGALVERALIAARRGAVPGLENRFRAVLRRELAALPYDDVQAELRAMKGSYEIRSRNLLLGYLENVVGPAAKGGSISRELAQLVADVRVAQDVLLPVREIVIESLGEIIAARAVEKPDIWAARDVALTRREGLRPVVIGIWDTGVDASLFEGRMWINTAEIPDNGRDDDGNGFVDDVHGIGFDFDGKPTTGTLFPHEFDAAEEAD
jgi:hypothetical protein